VPSEQIQPPVSFLGIAGPAQCLEIHGIMGATTRTRNHVIYVRLVGMPVGDVMLQRLSAALAPVTITEQHKRPNCGGHSPTLTLYCRLLLAPCEKAFSTAITVVAVSVMSLPEHGATADAWQQLCRLRSLPLNVAAG
jgi:hypothetical protein